MTQRRFVSMKDEHFAGLETTFTAENWSGRLEVSSGLDGRVENTGVKRYRDLNSRHLQVLGQGEVDRETIDLQVETLQSHVRVAVAARTRVLRDGQRQDVDRRLVEEPGYVAHELGIDLEEGRPATVEKIAALYTSRDRGISESRDDARLAAVERGGLLRAAGPARGRVEQPVEPFRHRARQRQRVDRDGPAPAHLPPAADRLAAHAAPGRRRPGPGLDRGGLPGSRLLGRDTHLPVLQLPTPEPGRRAAPVPLRTARHGPRRGARRGVRGRDVPVAERGHRSRGDPEGPPQPEVGPLAPRPLAQPAARQHRHRLQRVAALHGDREHGVPALHRRRAADRDRPVLGEHHHVQRRRGPVRDPRRGGPGRVPRGVPGLRRAGPAQQHLHQRHGGVGAAAGAGDAGRAAAALPRRARRGAQHPGRRAGALAGHHQEDEGRLPRRRRPHPVRGLRGNCPSSTGRATGSATATSSGSTGCWRPRATAPTGTSSPSRPTC